MTQLGTNGKPDSVSFGYHLFANTTYSTANDTGLTIDTQVKRGLSIEATGVSGISTYTLNAGPSRLHTEQWGKTHYSSNANGNSTSFGDTTDVFESNAGGEVYHRAVRALNGGIVYDNRDIIAHALRDFCSTDTWSHFLMLLAWNDSFYNPSL